MSPDSVQDLSLLVQAKRIESAIRGITQNKDVADAGDFGLPLDEAPLVSIVGDRGSGKTTLLRFLCQSLAQSGDFFVLPALRPETLQTSDSALVSMIGSALSMSAPGLREWPDNETYARIVALGQKSLRSALYATSSSISELFDGSASLGQFAVDSASILERIPQMTSDVGEFVTALLAGSGNQALIVPIDDVDLVPGRMQRLLADLRLMAQCPGVVPIVCLSWSDLRANLRAETSQLYPSLSANRLDRIVDQQVMKTLRPDRVFEPLLPPRNERLSFIPLGGDESLGQCFYETLDLLDDSPMSEPLGTWLDNRSREHPPNPIWFAWLPNTYRSLEHLYYSSQVLRSSLTGDRDPLEVAQQLKSLIWAVGREWPQLAAGLEVQSVQVAEGKTRLSVVVDWPDYTCKVIASSKWNTVFRNSLTRISLRAVDGIGVSCQEPQTGDRESQVREAGPVEASAALIIHSMLKVSAIEASKSIRFMALDDRDSTFLQKVLIVGLPTDDRIFILPWSDGAILVNRWVAAWNWFVESARQKGSQRDQLEYVVASYLIAVNEVWWLGGSPESAKRSRDVVAAMNRVCLTYTRVAPAYRSTGFTRSTDPAGAFCDWFERVLPFCFHEALLGSQELAAMLEAWQAALASTSRGEDAALYLAELFEARIRSPRGGGANTRDRVWFYGYRDLMRSVSQDLALMLNDYAKDYASRGGAGSRGRDAVDETVTLTESAGRYKYAPRPTLEGREQENTIRRLLDQLRQV